MANSSHKCTLPEGRDKSESSGCKCHPKQAEVALGTRRKQSKDTEELLRWIEDLNSGLSTQNWRVPGA